MKVKELIEMLIDLDLEKEICIFEDWNFYYIDKVFLANDNTEYYLNCSAPPRKPKTIGKSFERGGYYLVNYSEFGYYPNSVCYKVFDSKDTYLGDLDVKSVEEFDVRLDKFIRVNNLKRRCNSDET